MNMASIGTHFSIFLVICICAGSANKDFVSVQCKAENVGQYGQQSLLDCVVQTAQEVSNPEIRVVTWRKEGVAEPLVLFTFSDVKQKTGYKFAQSSWNNKNMNVSLLITNTEVPDEGGYTCTVITDSGDGKSDTKLKVTAKYSEPTVHSIPEKITQGTDGALICKSDGGYPKGQLRWFDEHNEDWTKSSEMQASQAKNGLFQLSSKLTLLRGSIFSKYTCVMFNASGGKEGEATFEVPNPNSDTYSGDQRDEQVAPTKIVAPVVVIGSLIIGLLVTVLFVLFCRRRSQQARKQSTTPLMGDHQEVCTCDIEEDNHGTGDKKCQHSQV